MQLYFTWNNIYNSFWNVSEAGFVITIYLADKIPFKRFFHGGGDGWCVCPLLCIISWSPPTGHLLYVKYVLTSPQVHPGAPTSPFQPRPQCIFSLREESEKEALEHFKQVIKICPNRGHIFMNKLGNTWAAILKTSTGSQLCLVSKAKDKNKIKTYEQSADRDISLKCILYWQTRKGI